MKKLTLLKSMLLLCALVVGSTSVWAGEIIYQWNGNGNTTTGNQIGGTAEAIQSSGTNIAVGNSQKGNYAFKLNKNYSSDDYYVKITLTNALKGGEKILVGAWRNGDTAATLGFDFGTTETQTLNSSPQVITDSKGIPVDIEYTVPAAAADSKIIRVYRNAGSTGIYVSKFVVESKEPIAPSATEPFTVTAIINSDGTCTCTPTSSALVTSGSTTHAETDLLDGYSNGLKLESKKGVITVTLPDGASNAKITLLSKSNTTSSVKIGGTSTPLSWTGDSENGYETTLNIASSCSITKGDGSGNFLRVTLDYDMPSDEKLTLTTTDNMDGWRTFYDATQDYEVDANTKIYVAAVSGTAGTVELTQKDATKIPHGEAVILKTSAGDHKMVLTKTTGATTLGDDNVLDYATSGTINGYRLGYKSGTGVAFYKYNAAAPASGVVYIDKEDVNTSTGAHEFLALSFGDDVTAINKVEAKKAENGVFYNLAGQQVAQPTKGLYIVNGKKVVLK